MSHGDKDDDQPTAILDLNAILKQKKKQEEDMVKMASELEFQIPQNNKNQSANFPVILFDFESDFFSQVKKQLPAGYEYKVIKTVQELNECLKLKSFQIVVFNYDVNPKAINQLCAQIKEKRPSTKTMIVASNIKPEKVQLHAKSPSGAASYLQLPLDEVNLKKEFQRLVASR